MRFLDHLEEWLITFLMGAATVVIFIAVVHRYASGWAVPGLQDWLLSINFAWAQELTIIMFVWMAKFGAAYGVLVLKEQGGPMRIAGASLVALGALMIGFLG